MYTQVLGGVFRQTLIKRTLTGTPRTWSEGGSLGGTHSPSSFDKKVLVWTKMFKTVEEIPDQVTFTKMRKARDKMRIRLNIGIGIAGLIGFISVGSYSKSKKGEGDSIRRRGMQWQADMQEKGRQERAAKDHPST